MDYLSALETYMHTDQFQQARKLMEKSGISFLAATNILCEAFYHGWKCHHDTPTEYRPHQIERMIKAEEFMNRVEALLAGAKNASRARPIKETVYRTALTRIERKKQQ